MLQSPPDEVAISTSHSKIPTPVKDGSTPETTDVTAFHAPAEPVKVELDAWHGRP